MVICYSSQGKLIQYFIFQMYLDLSGASDGKESACNAEDPCSASGGEDSLEKGRATHSSNLAWRILWIEEPSGL